MSKKTSGKPATKGRKATATRKKISKPAAKKTTGKKAAAKKVSGKKSAAKKGTGKKAIAKKALVKKTEKAVKKVRPALLTAIIDGMEEKKAKHITVLDLTRISGRAFDYFVIADADSGTHVESIAASVEETAKKKLNERPYHTEGWQNAEWILLDYINIIVHVFQRPVREFYNLEGLWADADVQKIN